MKYQEFKNTINKPFFRKSDVDFAMTRIGYVQLSRWSNLGYIQQVKRGLYVFSDAKNIDPRMISYLMYDASYISMESALRHYNLIPEMVLSITAVTSRTNREFRNQYGVFSYRHVKSELFFGYTSVLVQDGKYLIAEPEKALLDYVYLNQRRLKTIDDIEGLRLNKEELIRLIDQRKLKKYVAVYHSRNIERIINLILTHVNY